MKLLLHLIITSAVCFILAVIAKTVFDYEVTPIEMGLLGFGASCMLMPITKGDS